MTEPTAAPYVETPAPKPAPDPVVQVGASEPGQQAPSVKGTSQEKKE